MGGGVKKVPYSADIPYEWPLPLTHQEIVGPVDEVEYEEEEGEDEEEDVVDLAPELLLPLLPDLALLLRQLAPHHPAAAGRAGRGTVQL